MITADAAAIERIEKLAVGAAHSAVHRPPAEALDVYYLERPGHPAERIVAEAHPRAYRLYTIGDVVSAVKALPTDKPLILVGRGLVTVGLDEGGARREWLRFELPYSHEFSTCQRLEGREAFDQDCFVRLLRIDLAKAGPDVAKLRVQAEQIKFQHGDSGTATAAVGRQSIARSVISEVTGADGNLPEEIALTLFVYRDLAHEQLQCTIRCAVDVLPDENEFCLIPLAGEMEDALRVTDAWIVGQIVSQLGHAVAGANVLCGGR